MFDTDLFINEVSIRPPLWDIKLKDYSNRDIKQKLWFEVASLTIVNFEKLSDAEKNKEVTELKKKWKSLRDAFGREIRLLKLPSGSGQKKRKKYQYFDQMLFLTGNVTDRGTVSNFSGEHDDINENSDIEEGANDTAASDPEPAKRPSPSYGGRKCRQTPFELAVLKHLSDKKGEPTDEDEEADKNFLLSFLPMFKKLSLDQKLWVRMKFTETMQQAYYQHPLQPSHNMLPHPPNSNHFFPPPPPAPPQQFNQQQNLPNPYQQNWPNPHQQNWPNPYQQNYLVPYNRPDSVAASESSPDNVLSPSLSEDQHESDMYGRCDK